MIVIPTYNGYHHLKTLLEGIEKYGSNGHTVLVVDNGTTDIVSQKYLQSLYAYKGPLNIIVEKNKTKAKYETGALIHAVRTHITEESFLLLHDGCVPTSDQWLTQFEEKLVGDVGMVSWVKFQPCLFFMFDFHYEYMDKIAPHNDVPDGGVFGSIFMGRGCILRDFDRMGYYDPPPTKKIHAEVWERLWAILFHINGHKIDSIITGFDPNAIHHGYYPHLKKHFGGRT